MHIEDILAANGVGLWSWDNTAGLCTLDAIAARLLGLPPEEATLPETALRTRYNTLDYAELSNVAALAVTEGTVAEALLRVVDRDGGVLRIVRVRLALAEQPPEHQPDLANFTLHGLMAEASWPAGAPWELAEVPADAPLEEYSAPHLSLPERPGAPPAVLSPSGQAPVADDRRGSRESFLLDFGRTLAEAHTTREVLRVLGELSPPGLAPSSMVVYGVRGDRLTPIGFSGEHERHRTPFGEMTLESEYPGSVAARTGRAVYLSSSDEYRRRFPAVWPLVESYGRGARAYLPLIVAGRTIGTWMVAFRGPVAFAPEERYLLVTVARMLAQALSRVYVQEARRELADSLQRAMRPARRTEIPGMTLVSRYLPVGGGLQVGGDWYDVIPLPSGRTALVVGDVQGHDVRAAGVMTRLRIALRAYASEGHRPDAVLSRANRFLDRLDSDELSGSGDGEAALLDDHRFATCLYVEADPSTGSIHIARAGHPDPVVRMADGTVLTLAATAGPPLGVEPESDYPITRTALGPGETLLMCTDGLIEAGGLDYDTGWKRLRKALGERSDTSLEDLADALIRTMNGPPARRAAGTGASGGPHAGGREDDIALLLLGRAAQGPAPRRPLARRLVLSLSQAEQERVAAARHQLRELLYDWASDDRVEGAVLLLSELLTNALVHTEGDASLVAELSGERGARRLRVEVADPSDELPHRREPGELASRGRGLLLLEMLADSWGVAPRGEGKSIWFELKEGSARPAGG
ncbi:SpoIIE family protein phosphatase [Streptomyces desertarenae]|uniref:SpoIIE family protein phosphatase n=1 Tax=Streptomyces desertarenae TaxID=2666184 RepID=A0ABW4PG19_9ACTN